jgi:putative addiction module component (TIGR02574 family)
MSSEQLLKEALALPAAEKAKLAEELLSSLDDAAQYEIDRAWGDEAERRIAAFEKGKMHAEPVEDVIKAMRDRKR